MMDTTTQIEQIKKMGQETIIYGLGQFAFVGLNVILVPIYTNAFPPQVYSIIELLNITIILMGMLLAVGTEVGLTYYINEGRDSPSRVLTAVIQWHVIWYIVLLAITTPLWPILNKMLFEGQVAVSTFAIAMFGMLFTQLVLRLSDALKMQFRAGHYVLVLVLASLTTIVLATLFIYILDLGINGVFLATVAGAMVGSLTGFYLLRDDLHCKKFHGDLWPRLLRFGAPLLPVAVSTYFLSSISFWMINSFLPAADLGLFALGVKFTLVINVIMQVFINGYMPYSFNWLHAEDPAEMHKMFKLTFRYFFGGSMIIVIFLTFLSPYIISLIAPAEYAGAYIVVGPLVLSRIFWRSTYFSGLGNLKAEKTYYNSISAVSALVIGVSLNYYFVQYYGIQGAAVATTISMLALFVISFAFSMQQFPIKYDFPRTFLQGTICILGILFFYVYWQSIGNVQGVLLFGLIIILALLTVTVKRRELPLLWNVVNGVFHRRVASEKEGQ